MSNTGFENFLTGLPMHLHNEGLPSHVITVLFGGVSLMRLSSGLEWAPS